MSLSSVPSASVLIRVIKPDGLIPPPEPSGSYGVPYRSFPSPTNLTTRRPTNSKHPCHHGL